MALHQGDIGVIEKALSDYKLKAQEMNVGVNYMALDDERRRQEHLLRELREIEEEIASPNLRNAKLSHLASVVGMEFNHNTKCLQYLSGISELERSIGEVAAHFAERSVELSDPSSLHKDIVTYKTLTDNVKSCWTYVDQLATLAQIHLKTAAEYHQFFHESNEIEAKLEKQLAIAQKAHQSATTQRFHKEATKMAREIGEQMNIMRSLWQRSMNLVRRSETIVPIRLRLGGVAKGVAIGDQSNRPVMVRAMVNLTGPDYKIQKGEHLQLLDNRQESHLWRIQTSSGVAEVPSICFWLTDTDTEATDRAIRIKQQCKKTWLEIINLIRLRLYEVYVDLMDQFNSQEVICSHEEALNLLFSDLQKQLISTVGQDGRLKAAMDTFRKRVVITKRLERLQSGDINLRESDIVQIRTPLLRLQDHVIAAEQMQQEIKRLNDHITEFLSQVDNERQQIDRALDQLTRLTRQSEQQLNDVVRSMHQMRSTHERSIYAQAPARLKVEPLIVAEQQKQIKRSRSQPRMPVVNAISSSSTSSDTEPTSDPYIRTGGRRAKSQVIRLDAMVQIGSKSRTVETQHQDGRVDVGRHHSLRHKSVQLFPMLPTQRAVQTQIGCSVIDGGIQVDTSSLDSFNIEIKDDEAVQLKSSSEDEGDHEYVSEVAAAVPLQATSDKGRRKYTAAAQLGVLPRKKTASLTNLVHSCTQLGTMTSDKALSPVRGLGLEQSCPLCRSRTLLTSQTQVGPIYSGSERYQYYATYDVKSENGPSQHRISKKVQSGYPCLTDRANLYCQCDVLGPIIINEETEPELDTYQTPIPQELRKKMNNSAQVGLIYSNAKQQVGISPNNVKSVLTQVGIVYEEPYKRLPISPEMRSGMLETRRRSMHELRSSSTMIETVPIEPSQRVTAVSMRPQAASSTTQIGTLLTGNSMQTGNYTGGGAVSKRVQIGHPQLGGQSDSFAQVGQLYQQAEVQKGYSEMNVESDIAPILSTTELLEHSAPPMPKHPSSGISVQVTKDMYDDTTQIAQIISHDEVQTRDLQNLSIRRQHMQVYSSPIQKTHRSSSVPSVQFSTETQIGPVLTHENLSPIDVYPYTVSIRPTEMLNVQAAPKVMKSKRIQSVGMPSTRNVEMQIGQLLQVSGTQSLMDTDSFDETAIAPTLLSVQQKAISMPNVGVAEAQVHPSVHGKKLQVSITTNDFVHEKRHNKKLQVSVVSVKEMYDVQVETLPLSQKERFDVSCDTKIQPDKVPKKVQVSLMKENIPEIPMISNQEPLYAAMPSQSPIESIIPIQPDRTVEVFSAPSSQFTDTACEAITDIKYFDAQCQCEALKPVTLGKKLQVDVGGKVTAPDTVDTACDPINLVETVGKKLQVEMSAHNVILERNLSQTTSLQMIDEECVAMDERKMFDANIQTITTEEAPPIVMEKAPAPVYAAPPLQQKSDLCDAACEPLRGYSTSDDYTQSEKILGIGKKLQVAIDFDQRMQSIYEIASLQAYSEDTFVSLPDPAWTQPVYAAPPLSSPVDTKDRACEALSTAKMFDASVQAVEFEKPKPNVLGKKLQVSLSNHKEISTVAKVQAVQTEEFYSQSVPQITNLQETTNVFAVPSTPQQREPTKDRVCDAIEGAVVFDAGIQAGEIQTPKPASLGKKLQVKPMPLAIIGVQSNNEIQQPPPQIIHLEEAGMAFAAPPPAESKVQTEDRASDAIIMETVFDAGVQVMELEKPKPIVVGKKLQVTSPALAIISSQGSGVLTSPRKLQIDMEVSGVQTYHEPISIPPQVVHVEETSKVFAAPPPPQTIPTEDESCDPIDYVNTFNAEVQVAELEKPKPIGVGKKLQVTPSSLSFTTTQTIFEQPPSEIIHLDNAPNVYSAPPIPIQTQPKVQMNDRSCDAMEYSKAFDAGVQAAEISQPKAVVLGKKLQVTPAAMATISFQANGIVSALQTSSVQTHHEQMRTPPQIVHVEETSKVFAAPPPPQTIPTEDESCDPIDYVNTFDAGVQAVDVVQPKIAGVGKKLQVIPPALALMTAQTETLIVDKKLQVSPIPFSEVVASTIKPPVILGVSGVQTYHEPISTPPQQITYVEEVNKVFTPLQHQQCIRTEDESCDPLEFSKKFDAGVQVAEMEKPRVTTLGKKLQVTPNALSSMTTQTIVEQPVLEIRHLDQALNVYSAPPTTPPQRVQIDDSCDPLESAKTFDAGVQAADLVKPKPASMGKKLQVSSSEFIPVRPLGVDKVLQTTPITLEASSIQSNLEIIAPSSQLISFEDTSNVFSAPPITKPSNEDKECDVNISLPSFEVGVQAAEISMSKPATMGKKLQVSPAPYSIMNVQSNGKTARPTLVGREVQVSSPAIETTTAPQAPLVKVEDAPRVFAVPPSPLRVKMIDSGSDPLELDQMFDASVQSSLTAFPGVVEPQKKPITFGKKLQVDLHTNLAETLIQTATAVQLEVVSIQANYNSARKVETMEIFTETDQVQQPKETVTLGKKMQVDLRPPMDEKMAQTDSALTFEIAAIQVNAAPVEQMMIQEPIKESALLYSAPPKLSTVEHGLDARPLPLMNSTGIQSNTFIMHISSVQTTFYQAESTSSTFVVCGCSCSPLPLSTNEQTTQSEGVTKYGKKMQVAPPPLETGFSQTTWQETPVAPPLIKMEATAMVKSAPPLPPQATSEDMGCDPLPSKECNDAFTQYDPVVTFGKKMQVLPDSLVISSCQTVSYEILVPSPIIASRDENVKVFAAPPIKTISTEEKACEPMFKTLTNDFMLQYDSPVQKPPGRSVRIQKGVGAFEGTRMVGTQYIAPESRRSPLSPLLSRGSGIDWGVQIKPTTYIGTTQTLPMETPPIFTLSKPEMFSKTTQSEMESLASVTQTNLVATAPVLSKQPENLFSFVRETKARVTSRRSRSGSQGLIPYKTQVFDQPASLSASVPAMLNVRTDPLSPATITDFYMHSNRTTTSQVPRRYASRFRSPNKRGSYDRRNKSMENIYVRGSRTMPRHFISDSNLAMDNRWIQQQMELEQRCEECITQCVRLIGYNKVFQMITDTRDPGDIEQFDDLESYQVKRRRLQNARTQYTSTTAIACPYCYHIGVREVEGRTRWPSGAGEEEFYSGEDGYEWDSLQSSYGSTKHGTYKWISKTPVIRSMQTEPTSEEVDQLMKNRALSAYCSDYELQQSGINANFEENGAFTFVAWKTDHQGEDTLELDTVGRLLKLAMVGARVPGTGEVISASDAFYRGILRIIYMDDERGVIMPLTTAINANAVIVEKRFSTGVGIAFHNSPRKYPVECTAVWQTPNMRRRTYRVNYIRINDTERVPVSKAMDEGLIDKYSGEIIGVRAPPTGEMGDPLLQMRESSVGTGETMDRKHRPERFNIREAILNNIISVDLIQPEIILLPESEVDSATHNRRRDVSISGSTESNSDLEV